MKSTLLSLLLSATLCFSAKLPSSFIKCNRKQPNLNQCLSAAVENGIQQLDRPFKEIGLPTLNPLEIPALTIEAGKGAAAFRQEYRNMKVFGFGDIRCPRANLNFEAKTMFMECLIPKTKMDFDYEGRGKVLLLPIYGKGHGTILLDNLNETFTFQFEEYQRKNAKHYKVTNARITMDPSLITFDLENLFNGDKNLGDTILQVMNENWKEVFADVRESYEEVFAQVAMRIFNDMLKRVSAQELFGDE